MAARGLILPGAPPIIGPAPLAVRNGLPVAPHDLQDEVELFAREYGRTGKLHFVPVGGWMARFSLRCNDPRMVLYQRGEIPEPLSEDVWFHEPNPNEGQPNGRGGRQGPFIPLDILQMGTSGVREFLEKGNTWSGRGEFTSLEAAVKQANDNDVVSLKKFKAEQKDASLQEQKAKRRTRFGIPFVPVQADLKTES